METEMTPIMSASLALAGVPTGTVSFRVNAPPREEEWAIWMRAALSGDAVAYRRFLGSVMPFLRALVHRHVARAGLAVGGTEDVVQEALLAIHLKRDTRDQSRPISPWISVIARNKLIDALRRRKYRADIPIENVIETLRAEEREEGFDGRDLDRLLGKLSSRQRDIVRSISIEGASARQTAERLNMSEGAVRVALHRALKMLAALYLSDTP
jgi:RNA polymerase sigma-70 factor (ECF subfamily)